MSDHDRDIERLIQSQPRARFGPGFADRVLARVAAEPRGTLASLSFADFVPVAAAALIACAALAAFSLVARTDATQTAWEAMFGLPPVTADAVFDGSDLFSNGISAT